MTSPEPFPTDSIDRFDNVVGRMPFTEFLDLEDSTGRRYEYVEGVVYAMTRAALRHGTITLNIGARLRHLVRGTECRAFTEGTLVRTPRDDAYSPDVLVRCGPPLPGDARYLTDPCLLVEVLSPSTSRYDFGEKREHYLTIPSLRTYLIVETEWRCVHRYWRDDAGVWQYATHVGADAVVPLPCPPGATLRVAEIYEDVDVGDDPPRPRRVREPSPAASEDDGEIDDAAQPFETSEAAAP